MNIKAWDREQKIWEKAHKILNPVCSSLQSHTAVNDECEVCFALANDECPDCGETRDANVHDHLVCSDGEYCDFYDWIP